jgi:hypothetical protein
MWLFKLTALPVLFPKKGMAPETPFFTAPPGGLGPPLLP